MGISNKISTGVISLNRMTDPNSRGADCKLAPVALNNTGLYPEKLEEIYQVILLHIPLKLSQTKNLFDMNTKLIKYLSASFISIVMLFGFNVEKLYAVPIEGIHTRYGIYGDPPEQYQFRDIPESIGYLTEFPLDLITKLVGEENLKNINLEYWVYTSIADAEMAVVEQLDWTALLLNNMIDSPLDKGLIGDNCWHTIKETGSVMFIRNNVFVFITPAIYPQFDPTVIEQIARVIDSILTKAPKVNVRSEIHSPTINSVDIESSYPKDIKDFVRLRVDAVDTKYTKIHFRLYSFPRSFESETGYLTAYFNKNMYVIGDTTKAKVKIWVWNEDHLVTSTEQIIPFLTSSSVNYKDPTGEGNSKVLFLNQNSPNPFNTSTLISFTLKENLRVKLGIYAISGSEIVLLANRNFNEGVYQFNWDGKDKNGHTIPSGTYFCILKAGVFADMKKIVFTR